MKLFKKKKTTKESSSDSNAKSDPVQFDVGFTCARESYPSEAYRDFLAARIEKYKIDSCEDQRVCSACRAQHGRVYSIEEFKPGSTAPPFCDGCRCIMMPEYDGLQ